MEPDRSFYEQLDLLYKENNGRLIERFLESEWKKAKNSDNSRYVLIVANELGGWSRAKGNIARAKKLYEKALEEVKRLYGMEHVNYATTLINTGDVYIQSKEYELAREYFMEAKNTLEKLEMDESYQMAAILNNISVVYREEEDFLEAINAIKKALLILEKLGDFPEEIATTLINLGQLEIKEGNYENAEQDLLNAISYYEHIIGKGNPHYSVALAGLGEAYFYQQKYDQAERIYTNALLDIETRYGKDAPIYEFVNNNLNKVKKYMEMG